MHLTTSEQLKKIAADYSGRVEDEGLGKPSISHRNLHLILIAALK